MKRQTGQEWWCVHSLSRVSLSTDSDRTSVNKKKRSHHTTGKEFEKVLQSKMCEPQKKDRSFP